MKDRIEKLLAAEQLTSAKFADTIGVQRSSVSHILSGRNKPSLDFITKILETFTSINPDWLLMGKGKMYKKEEHTLFEQPIIKKPDPPPREKSKEPEIDPLVAPVTKNNQVQADVREQAQHKTTAPSAGLEGLPFIYTGTKELESVVIFYTDKTCKAYKVSE